MRPKVCRRKEFRGLQTDPLPRRHYNPASLPQLAVIAIDSYWGPPPRSRRSRPSPSGTPTAKIQCAHSAVQGQDEAGPQRLAIVKSALADLTTATRQGRAVWRGSGRLGGESRWPLEPDEADQVGTVQVGVVQFCVDQVGGRIAFRLLMTCDGS